MRRGSKWSLCGWRAGKKLPIMEVRVDAFAEVRARVGSDPRRTWPLSEAEHSVGWSLSSTSRWVRCLDRALAQASLRGKGGAGEPEYHSGP